MTEKLYDLDSTRLMFVSQVIACLPAKKNSLTGYAVELAETCFFPEGGGQPADVGLLGEVPVLYTYEEGDRILHLCSQPLAPGQTVTGQVEPTQRLQNMQIHSGEHILSGIILRKLGLKNIGFHMGKETNTIDLDGPITADQCDQIEAEANFAITANLPVTVSYPADTATLPLRKRPEVEALRVVEVAGYDLCGCCGTHVADTGEIGLLKIIDAQTYKGGTRLTFLCGRAAVEDYRAKHRAIKAISASLSCKPLEIDEAVSRLLQETGRLKAQTTRKNQALFGMMSDKLLQVAPRVGEVRWVFFWDEEFSADELKALAMRVSKEEQVFCTAFAGNKAEGLRYALAKSADSALDLPVICKELNRLMEAKGGGGKELCCGKADTFQPAGQVEQHIRMLLGL